MQPTSGIVEPATVVNMPGKAPSIRLRLATNSPEHLSTPSKLSRRTGNRSRTAPAKAQSLTTVPVQAKRKKAAVGASAPETEADATPAQTPASSTTVENGLATTEYPKLSHKDQAFTVHDQSNGQ